MILATHLLIIIAITGLFAGFIDAIVGGGGLLTTPVLLALWPTTTYYLRH